MEISTNTLPSASASTDNGLQRRLEQAGDLFNRNQFEACVTACDAILSEHDLPDIATLKAMALAHQGDTEQGLALIAEVLAGAETENTTWLERQARILNLAGQFDEALKVIDYLLAVLELDDQILIFKVAVLIQAGRYQEAQEIFQITNMFKIKPFDYALNQSLLARRLGGTETAVKALEDAMELTTINDGHERHLYSEHAALMDQLGEYDRSFESAMEANHIADQMQTVHFDYATHEKKINQMLRYWSKGHLESLPHSRIDGSNTVFIVGFPRSGSTLLEQMLDSHSQAFGVGEVNWAPQAAAMLNNNEDRPLESMLNTASLDSALADRMAASYLDKTSPLAAHPTDYSVDKMLDNYKFVGLISRFLPGARFLWIQRHPLDCILSAFFQNFRDNLPFGNLLQLANLYHDMYRTMGHWQRVAPDSIHAVRYERLVENPQRELKAALDFIGLPWEEECLRFHQSKRIAKTASRHQVNREIYTSSTARWRHYEKYLSLVICRLQDRGVLDENMEPDFA